MNPFFDENFLLLTDAAQRLYFDYAEKEPIYDFHCHLSPNVIAENKPFRNLAGIWLDGDHYKWRVLRTAGVDEHFITGNATDYEKYFTWSKVVSLAFGNPVYHWTHLELRRPFGLNNVVFNEKSADYIWDYCNERLACSSFFPKGILKQMNVKLVGTTDDPIDDLCAHEQIAADTDCDTHVIPTWRPDPVLKIDLPGFTNYIRQLSKVADIEIISFDTLKQALFKRLDHFQAHDCKAADHGMERVRFEAIPAEREIDAIISKRLSGQELSELEIGQFSTALFVWLGQEYYRRGWVLQMHIGALRNNNQRMFQRLGADTGFDSIADRVFAEPLSKLLNSLDITETLPRTILYCLNPRDNEMVASMIGNFQGGGIPGKIQFGSGWWFNDQKDGMERQLMQLSQLGLLSQFIGMLTDSRSFLSYTRHEYFRRILCNMVGSWMDKGEIPADFASVGSMIKNICYHNAKGYFEPGAQKDAEIKQLDHELIKIS